MKGVKGELGAVFAGVVNGRGEAGGEEEVVVFVEAGVGPGAVENADGVGEREGGGEAALGGETDLAPDGETVARQRTLDGGELGVAGELGAAEGGLELTEF